MGLFRYRALTSQGAQTEGVIDADSYQMAKEKLRKEKIFLTHLEPFKGKRKELSLSLPLLLDFTRAMGQLLRAGLPLYESLLTLEEKYRRHRIHPLLLDLSDQVKGGASLSSALSRYERSFNGVYICMVKAAEQTASLSHIFEQLSLLISREHKLKKQILSAAAYPAILSVFCLVVISILLLFVIPSMAELFEGRKLHPITHTVLWISDCVITHLNLLLSTLGISVLTFCLWVRRKGGKALLQRGLLKTPFLKTLILQSALLRFSRSFSILLAGGVPFLDALSLSRHVMNHTLLASIFEQAEKGVMEGKSLSSTLRRFPLIPPLITRMISLSEETGKMGQMFSNIADIYEEELEKNFQQLTLFLQPALLIFIGAIVGIVLLSLLIPVTDINFMQ